MNKQVINIATWNVSEGISTTWDLSNGISHVGVFSENDLVKEIIKKINDYHLDIICFQEFPILIDQQEWLKEKIINETDLKFCSLFATAPSFLFQGGEIGVALFSKYPIIEESKTYFANPHLKKISKTGKEYFTFDKGMIDAKIAIANKTISVVTGHAIAFEPFDQTAENFPESYEPLSNLIESHHEEPLIVCGDFNTEHLFDLIPKISNLVEDIISGNTTPSGKMEGKTYDRGRKLDYLLINQYLKTVEISKLENLSDHDLIIAKLSIE